MSHKTSSSYLLKIAGILLFLLFGAGTLFLSGKFSLERGFQIYVLTKKHEAQNNFNTVLPEKIGKILSLGHENSYSDFLWISLIQYIGGHTETNDYIDFALDLLETITKMKPEFLPAYEWAALLAPFPPSDTIQPQDATIQKIRKRALDIAIGGMKFNCDMQKVQTIMNIPDEKISWNEPSLRNPCKNGMIPYYIAFQIGKNGGLSKQYYKVAGMQDDAPEISTVLAALSKYQDPLSIALEFAWMGMNAADTSEEICKNISEEIIQYSQNSNISLDWIMSLEQKEKQLKPITTKNIQNIHTCYDFAERSISYIFIDYITKQTKNLPELTTSQDLIQHKILPYIPVPKIRKNMNLQKRQNNWGYFPAS